MKTILWVVPICCMLACGSDNARRTAADSLTERQHDSILANSKIPNARAVGSAMRAADSTSAGIGRADSVARDTTQF